MKWMKWTKKNDEKKWMNKWKQIMNENKKMNEWILKKPVWGAFMRGWCGPKWSKIVESAKNMFSLCFWSMVFTAHSLLSSFARCRKFSNCFSEAAKQLDLKQGMCDEHPCAFFWKKKKIRRQGVGWCVGTQSQVSPHGLTAVNCFPTPPPHLATGGPLHPHGHGTRDCR